MTFPVYADTGLLCSLYAPDEKSSEANNVIQTIRPPLPFTWLHQVEFRNALRLRVFRKQLTLQERDSILQSFFEDFSTGLFIHEKPEITDLLLETERLGASHTEKQGCRSLDLMHVAMALILGTNTFAGFDQRQNQLARAAGLKVLSGTLNS